MTGKTRLSYGTIYHAKQWNSTFQDDAIDLKFFHIEFLQNSFKMCDMLDFPGGSEVNNLTQGKKHGLIPDPERSHTPAAQLSSPTVRPEPELWARGHSCWSPWPQSWCSAKNRRGENPAHHSWTRPPWPEKSPDAEKTQPSQK